MASRILALFLGLVLTLIFLVVVECIFYLNEKYMWFKPIQRSASESVKKNHEFIIPSRRFEKILQLQPGETFLNYREKWQKTDKATKFRGAIYYEPGTQYNSKVLFNSGRTLYDKVISIDSKGRRVTSAQPSAFSKQLIVIGGSFAFGEGLADHETIPSVLQENLKETLVVNLGIGGGSPADLLAYLNKTNNQWLNDLNDLPTKVLYISIPDHIRRVTAPLSAYMAGQEWILLKSNFEKTNDQLIDTGNFLNRGGWKGALFPILAKSSILRFFQIDSIGSDEITKYVDITYQTLEHIRTKINRSVEMHYVFPSYDSPYSNQVKQGLTARGIQYIDLNEYEFSQINIETHAYPLDGHPTPEKAYIFAHFILNLIFNQKSF